MSGDFRKWVARLFQSKTAARAADCRKVRRASVFRIESLEDRVVPAITVLDAATGGSLDGDLLADGIVSADGTLSRGALTSVAAATNISVTAATGDITFNGFAATVTLLTGGGSSATFTAPGAITFADPTDNFATSGGGLVFTAGAAATLASLSGGSLDAQAGGTLAVTSATTTGAIDLTSTGANVSATGTLQTPGQLTLVAATGIAVQTSAATLQASNSTSGDITVTQTAAPSQLLTITNTAGGVVNAAPGGRITITNLGSGLALDPSAPVQTAGGGDITLAAQDFIIDPTATVNAGAGVTTLANSDAGRQINLGGNGVTVGKLTLTQAELDRVTGTGVLRIGSATAGAFEVNAPINADAPVARAALTLVAGPGGISDTGAGAVVATNLRLTGTGDVVLTNGAGNNVANLVADVAGTADRFVRFDNGVEPLTVGAGIDGVTGITVGGTDAFLILSADDIEVANPINVTAGAGGGRVTIVADTAGRPIDLGTETGGSLSLTAAELGRITAEGLVVGNIFTGGAITVTQPIALTTVDVLDLSGGLITDTGAGSIQVDYLVGHSYAGVLLDAAGNNVNRLSGLMVGSNDTRFEYRDADGFVIDTTNDAVGFFDGVRAGNTLTGIRITLAAGGPITQTAGSVVVADGLQLLGTGPVTLTDPGNDANALAAALTGAGNALTYVDADDLAIGIVGSTSGVTTTGGVVDVTALTGALTVGAAASVGTIFTSADVPKPVPPSGTVGTTDSTLTVVGGPAAITDVNVLINLTHTWDGDLAISLIGPGGQTVLLSGNRGGSGDNYSNTVFDDEAATPISAGVAAFTGSFRPEAPLSAFDGLTANGTWTLRIVDSATGDSGTLLSWAVQFNLAAAYGVTTGGADVNYTADNMSLVGPTNAGAGTATLRAVTAGTAINLGGADGPTTLGLTDAELDTLTAGVVIVGDAAAGDITVTSAVSPGGTSQLELVTAAGVLDGSAGLDDITVARLGITAGTGIGVSGGDVILDVLVSNFEAATGTGGVFVANTGAVLTIGNVNGTLSGVDVTTSGSVSISNNNSITVTEAVTAVGGGDIALTTTSNNITVNAAVSATGGDGNVTLNAEDDVNVNAAVSAAGAGDVTVIAEPTLGNAGTINIGATGSVTAETGDIRLEAMDNVNVNGPVAVAAGTGTIRVIAEAVTGPSAAAGNFTSAGLGTLTTAGGDIYVQAGDSISVGAAVTAGGAGTIAFEADAAIDGIGSFSNTAAVGTAGGNILVRAFDASIGAAIDATTGVASRVILRPRQLAAAVNLGTDTPFGLTDTELDFVTAGTLQIGDATHTGDINLTGTVSLDPTLVPVASLITTGAVADGTAGDVQDDLFVESLAIQTGTGVGSADTINIAVTNLAVNNTTSGNVFISNHVFSAGGPLNLTVVDGVIGVHNAGPGDIFITNAGGQLSVVEEVAGTGGGNVSLLNTGAGADIVVDDNGRVAATGGNGNVVIDSTGATSGGAIVINATSGIEVQASGPFGSITISARDAVTLASAAQVQAGNTVAGGDISVSANVGVPGGGADITLIGTSSIQTLGNVSLTTDPDFVLTGTAGADIVMSPASIIKGNGNTLTDNKSLTVVLRADGDVVVSNVWADTDLAITAAENIVDDAVGADATFIQATDIQLIAGGIIGGAVQITPTDVFSGNTGSPTAAYRGAIDFDIDNGGSLIVTSGAVVVLTGTGGNVQLRQVDDPLDVNPEPVRTQDLNVTAASINSDNQLAVVSSAGDFLVDSGFVVPSNADVLLATTAGFSVVISGGVTNPGGMNADTVIVASGSPTAGITGTVGGVADVVGPNVNLVTQGGTIGVGPAATLEINATRLDGQTAGGSAFITDTQNGVAVGLFNAGAGAVLLRSLGNNGTAANITAVTYNDNAAEIVAGTVTLDTTAAGPVAGPNGQIGQPGLFFEVNANTINAATNNSSLWISEVGTGGTAGATVGSVTAGTATAFLRVRNGGTLTGAFDGVADVVAATVNLSNVAGDTPAGGNFGTVATPLEIDATTLSANLPGGGNVFVNDLAGGVTVARATTTGGNVGILTVGGNITIGTGANPAIDTNVGGAATGTVYLTATGGSVAGPAGVGGTDVRALNLALDTDTGVGTGTAAAGALQTAVTNVAFNNAAGAVNITNAGPLTVTVVAGLATSTNLGTTTTITASSPLTFAVNTTTTGDTVYTAGETADAPTFADDLTVNAGVTVSVTGGNLTLQAGDQVVLNGTSAVTAGGTITLNVGFNDLDGVGGATIRGTVDAGAGVPLAQGGAGADTVLVDYTGGAALPDGLGMNGGGGNDELQVSDAGGGASHAYVVNLLGVVRDAAAPLFFGADVETVRVVGGDLADTFTVTAGAFTAIDVQGGPPTTPTGDTLAVTNAATAFLTATGTGSVSGTYDFPAGTADVTFSNIETLNTGADAVSVTKSDGVATAIPGTTVTYTVVVTNNATVGLTGIRVQDLVPVAITGASFTAVFAGTGSTGNVGPTAGNSIDQTISLAAGGTATYTITGTLAPTTPAGIGTLVNTVAVTPPAGVTDDPLNNTATDTDDVVPTGDVAVTKTNGATATVPGTTTVYTIVVSNSGPSTVQVSFADTFPAAVASASWSAVSAGGATGAPVSGSGNIANTLTIPGGGSVTYTVNAAVGGAATGTLVNTAAATILTPGFDQGGATGNDSATDTDTLTPQGDVTVTKTNGVTTVTAGSTTTYTITVSNTGPSTVTVPFADTLPAQITTATRTVVNGGGATGGTAGTGNIADTLTLPAGGTVTYTLVATINPAAPAGTLVNTATATVPGGFDQGANAGPDTATDTDTLVAAPDLALSANAPLNGKVGTAFSYTFTVSNFGQSTQTNVLLTHALPVESINGSAASTQGTAAIAGGVLTASIGTLAPGASATVTVTITPTDDGAFALVGTVTGALPEPNTTNNSAAAVTQVAPYQPLIVAGPGNGGGAEVRVLNANTGALEARFIPFGPFYSFAMSVAQGDINGDGVPEIIVGSGPGGAARVVVYDVRTGAELRSFFAFEPTVTGGVNVGAGDLDGDGKDDIITGAGAGFGPRVRAFSGATNAEIRSFFAYEASFTGGVRVAAGDTNGDGRLDIITGAGGGGSSRVQVFDGTTLAVLQNFFAYGSGLREGVYVAAADTNGDGIAEIVTGAGGGGASHIKVFDGKTLGEKASFFAFAPTSRDGVTVGKTDRNSDGVDDITAGTGVGVQAQVKVFSGTGAEETVFNAFDIGFVNGVYVG